MVKMKPRFGLLGSISVSGGQRPSRRPQELGKIELVNPEKAADNASEVRADCIRIRWLRCLTLRLRLQLQSKVASTPALSCIRLNICLASLFNIAPQFVSPRECACCTTNRNGNENGKSLHCIAVLCSFTPHKQTALHRKTRLSAEKNSLSML